MSARWVLWPLPKYPESVSSSLGNTWESHVSFPPAARGEQSQGRDTLTQPHQYEGQWTKGISSLPPVLASFFLLLTF